ncbi:conjugal transfer protein, partial [Streptomyces alkaliphilus]|nr:conjugal transfer protein [Streptomyces alkaliphilus]
MPGGVRLTRVQKVVLTAAFVPMLATGVAGGIGTYSNIESAYGAGTAMGAVSAGEGATAVLALVLLGLTLLGQSSPAVVRAGLWLLPAAASAMSLTAAEDLGQKVVYAITPMGMTVAAEGMAFLARRIVVHQNGGRDVEADARAAAVVQELAYHRARATSHPDEGKRRASERRAWKLARRVGRDDPALAGRLLTIQRDRLQSGADAALAAMFNGTPT